MPTLFALARFLGLQGLVVVAVLIFYEGLPGANYLTPYLRIVPALGPMVDDLAQGRVGRARLAGRLDERLVWQEGQRRAELARAAEREKAQAKLGGSTQLGTCKVLDPDGAIREVRERLAGLPAVHAYTWLSLGDMPDDLVERHVELWCGPVREALAS